MSTSISIPISTPGLPEKYFLCPGEVAKFFSVSVRTVYRWIETGELEGRKIAGTTVRIPRESVIKISGEST